MRNAFIPPTALRMLRSAPHPRGRHDCACARVGSGGEALGAETYEWGKSALGLTINEFYGQTECNLVLASCAAIGVSRPGAIGKPVPGHTVAVIRPDGSACAPGELGQIAIQRPDPVMFLEYWGKPDATRDKFIGDWMTTGDQGVVDDDGYVQFVGRDDDVITSSGYRIGPGEIEDCLIRHPAVALAAVVGKPDPVRTEIVKAFIVLKSGRGAVRRARRRDSGLRQDAAVRARISARGRLHRADADDDDRQGDPAVAAAAGVRPSAGFGRAARCLQRLQGSLQHGADMLGMGRIDHAGIEIEIEPGMCSLKSSIFAPVRHRACRRPHRGPRLRLMPFIVIGGSGVRRAAMSRTSA